MILCHVCKQGAIDTPWETAVAMCTDCANTFGIMPMLPARRPARPCDRCNGMQFIRAVPRELAVGKYNAPVSSPMAVTYDYQYVEGAFTRSAAPVDTRKAYGYLEQYICRKCGFVEWYCNDPDRIPIGPGFMTEAIDYAAGETPYRG